MIKFLSKKKKGKTQKQFQTDVDGLNVTFINGKTKFFF